MDTKQLTNGLNQACTGNPYGRYGNALNVKLY